MSGHTQFISLETKEVKYVGAEEVTGDVEVLIG